MSESPEEVRERVRQEELAKGSDPRVVEGRAKAAEARAREGLPIDPEQAWREKLAHAGREPAAPAEAPPAEAAAEEAAPAETAPAETAPAETAPAETAPAETAPAETAPAETAPAETAPAETEAPPAPQVAAPQPAAPEEPDVLPEVGEIYEADEVETREVAGLRVRTVAISKWVVALMAAVAIWAILYLIVLSGGNVVRETTGCVVAPDGTFTCFHPKTDAEGTEAGH